jgi:hypothetical protein
MWVCVELSVDVAVICGAARTHLVVPKGIRLRCSAVSCAKVRVSTVEPMQWCQLPVNLSNHSGVYVNFTLRDFK